GRDACKVLRAGHLNRYAFQVSAIPCGLARRFPFRVTQSPGSATPSADAPGAGARVRPRRRGPLARWGAGSASSQRRALADSPLASSGTKAVVARVFQNGHSFGAVFKRIYNTIIHGSWNASARPLTPISAPPCCVASDLDGGLCPEPSAG